MKVIEVINVDFSLRHFLLPLMRGLRARGHEVIGACAEGPLLEPVRAEGFRVEALPPLRSLSPLAMWRGYRAMLRLFRAERPDVVHAHMPISGFLARLAARRAGVPRVAYTCHGFLFHQPGPWPRRAASFAMEFFAGRLTDIFLAVSEEEAKDAVRLRVARRASFTRNGRDPALFRPDPAARREVRAELGVPQDRVAVVIVSRLVSHKGHGDLVAAMERVPDVELWVAGDRLATDRGEDLGPMFAASSLGPRLRLLGYRADVARVLAAADVFALPSRFEGLPMSVIEAMLTGLPVVASDIRGPREQVVDGETGWLAPPGDPARLAAALARLTGDAALRAKMGRAGRERAVALYDEARVVERTCELLGL